MNLKLLIISLGLAHSVNAQLFQKIHRSAIVVDTHNDILLPVLEKGLAFDTDLKGKTHSDLNRWKRGGIDVQFFSVWCDGTQVNPFKYALWEMDTVDAVAKRNPDKMKEVFNSKQMFRTVRHHK